MKRLVAAFSAMILLAFGAVAAEAYTYTIGFTAGQIKAMMDTNVPGPGDHLHGGGYAWGINRILVNPDISGDYTIIAAGAQHPAGWTGEIGAYPRTNPDYSPYFNLGKYYRFYDIPGMTHESSPNPAYLITDLPMNYFPVYEDVHAGDYDPIVKLPDSSYFSFQFSSDSPWAGGYRFLVDGNGYRLENGVPVITENYYTLTGKYHVVIDGEEIFPGDVLPGYEGQAPAPATWLLMASGLMGLGLASIWRKARQGKG
jgi:hypothetical protein